MKLAINVIAKSAHEFYGTIHLDDELVFSVIAPDISICCQFVMHHKNFLDEKCLEVTMEEQEITPQAGVH